MKVIKADDTIQEFCIDKIKTAIQNASDSVLEPQARLTEEQMNKVIATVMKKLEGYTSVSVNDIHDFVEQSLVRHNKWLVSRAYITGREEKSKRDIYTPTEKKFLSIVNGTSELRGDNANKHIDDNGSVRDYGAGLLCKSIADKQLPKEVLKADAEGWLHFHDKDYSPVLKQHNCDVLNIEDMTLKGFAMGDCGVFANDETPFRTASNILSQISEVVSGRQYGGQTITWSHVVRFVDQSRHEFISTLNKVLDIDTIVNEDDDIVEE